MILFVSRAVVSQEVTAWVHQETGIDLHVAASFEQASQLLRAAAYRVVVVDAGWLETDPKGVDQLLSQSPAALPIFPNLAVCGPERLVCEIKAALRRAEKEGHRAADCARREFRSSLKDSVTALLLNCDLALELPDLPNEAGRRILLLHDLATKMRNLLEIEMGQAASA
jgi:hypothetical protein